MKLVLQYFRELGQGVVGGWNRFWFAPSDPATLGMIRILAGAMLLYTHCVWSLGLNDFFGACVGLGRSRQDADRRHVGFELVLEN